MRDDLTLAFNRRLAELQECNPALARRVRDVLHKMAMVAEGSAAAPFALSPPEGRRDRIDCPSCRGEGEVPLHKGTTGGELLVKCPRCKGTGKVAASARSRSIKPHHEGGGRPPGDAETMVDHYMEEFLGAPHDLALEIRVADARTDYLIFTGQLDGVDPEQRRAEAERIFGSDGAAMEEAQAQRVLARYKGRTAEHAALLEGEPRLVGWIEKIRRQHGYDENGLPRPQWERWDRSTRIEQVRALRRRQPSISQRAVADHFQAHKTQIERLWNESHPRRAAA